MLHVSARKSEPSEEDAADRDEQDHDDKGEEEKPTVDEPEEVEEERTPKSKDDADAKVQAKGKAKPKLTFKLPGEPGADVPKNQTQPLKGCLRTSMRKPASASGQSIADELMQKQRTARDEKRQQQMVFARSLVPSKRADPTVHDPKKCPSDMLPNNPEERRQLWQTWRENMGNYDKIRASVRQTKKRRRGGKRGRVWTFVKDVKDQICNGNAKRAESMIKRLQAPGGQRAKGPKVDYKRPKMDSNIDSETNRK